MYEHRSEVLLSRPAFLRRMARHGVLALLVVLGSLLVGLLGFHFLGGQPWIDALLNAAMLLGGMGPVGDMGPTLGKLFATAYALYAGLVFLIVASVLFAPLFHRVVHKLHMDLDDADKDS
jgi:hypothetical protein